MDETFHDGMTHVGELAGHPAQDAMFEHHQNENFDCAEASIADVINEQTGTNLTDEQLVQEASSTPSTLATDPLTGQPLPMYDPQNGGTCLQDAPALLAAHGVDASYTDDSVAGQAGYPATGMDALQNEMQAGHPVLVAVDGPKIWAAIGQPDPDGDPNKADHVVQVTGIDTTNDIVYLNDTGIPDGAGEAVPMSVFEQAWALSNHAMVAGSDAGHPAIAADPATAPGPLLPTPACDPFAPDAEHPVHLAEAAVIAGAVGAVAVGAAALSSRQARIAAVAKAAAILNNTRTTAATQADRARAWFGHSSGQEAQESASPTTR
jgi:hypothetical protein